MRGREKEGGRKKGEGGREGGKEGGREGGREDNHRSVTIVNRCMYTNQSIHHIIYSHTNSSPSYHLPSTR